MISGILVSPTVSAAKMSGLSKIFSEAFYMFYRASFYTLEYVDVCFAKPSSSSVIFGTGIGAV